MTARRGCHETPAPSGCLAVRGARPLGPLNLAADERAGLEDALMPECRLLIRFLSGQPVCRRAWIAVIDVIDVILYAHGYFNPDCITWTAHPPLLPPVQLAAPKVE